MNELDDNVLKIILQPFNKQPESYFLRLVCKRWASIVNPTEQSIVYVASRYAEYGNKKALEMLQERCPT